MSSTHKLFSASRARRLLAAAVSTAAITAGLVGVGATSASASPNTCSVICGAVYNSDNSASYVRVGSPQKYYTLRPGMNSTPYIKNVESLYIPSGYCGYVRMGKFVATYSPGWHDGIVGIRNMVVSERILSFGLFPSC